MRVISVDFHIKPPVGTCYAKNIDINYTDSFVQALEYAEEELEKTLMEGSVVYSVRIIDWKQAEDFEMVTKLPEGSGGDR